MEADLEICFVERILNAMMKHATVRFLCILGIQYIIVVFLLYFPLYFHLLTHHNFYWLGSKSFYVQ